MSATGQPTSADFDRYRGMTGRTLVAGMPLERDTLRRFVQAIMDTDPLYVDAVHAAGTVSGWVSTDVSRGSSSSGSRSEAGSSSGSTT